MVDVIAHAEAFQQETADALRRPQLRGVPGVLRASGKKANESSALSRHHLWRSTRTRPATQGVTATPARPLQPLAHRGPADSKLAGNVGLTNTLAVQRQSLEPAVLEGDGIARLGHARSVAQEQPFVNTFMRESIDTQQRTGGRTWFLLSYSWSREYGRGNI